MSCFALLDDCHASPSAPTSRIYTRLRRMHVCTEPRDLDRTWAAVMADLDSGWHAVVVADYEWGVALAGLAPVETRDSRPNSAPALRVLMFAERRHCDVAAVDVWLQHSDHQHEPRPAGLEDLQCETRDVYDRRIAEVLEYIRDGETYQVNYTYRAQGSAFGSPLSLYRRLRRRQPVAYGALIALPQDHSPTLSDRTRPARWVLSCSPELFVHHEAGRVTVKPMKGTAVRQADAERDRAAAIALANDEKNRAENLMIVDLMRNDVGRLARVGSVSVDAMFAVETLPTVHQMTSTIRAELAPSVDMPQLLRALLPCGSITGAPKRHTMELISRLEATPRGIYTGAIGWVDAPTHGTTVPSTCLSVAIRSLLLEPDGERCRATLGVGGGIVADSTAADEYAETRIKLSFVSGLDPGFTLFETLLVDSGRRVAHLEQHLERLRRSARSLGFAIDIEQWRRQVELAVSDLHPMEQVRLRIDLRHDGTLTTASTPLVVQTTTPVRLLLSDRVRPRAEMGLSMHKTSVRHSYDDALAKARQRGFFDMLFVNRLGHVTEGACSNVFALVDDRWLTPKVSDGALPGTARSRLLRELCAVERRLTISDLMRARQLLVCNSLRGALCARLSQPGQVSEDDEARSSSVPTAPPPMATSR